jgi:energy-coupling factor transporter transmembrane protein EcfT
MSQLIAWIVVLLILVFIYKIGSFLWRTLGIVLLLFLIWVYREEIMTQLNQWTQNFRWGDLSTIANQVWQWIKDGFQSLQNWVTNL